MVSLSALVPDVAYTAAILGTERSGNGCVIGDDGLVLTIGYLVTKARTIWITDPIDRDSILWRPQGLN